MRRFFTILTLSLLPLTGCAVGDTSPYDGGDTEEDMIVVVPEDGIVVSSRSLGDPPAGHTWVDINGTVTGDRNELYGAVVMAHDIVSDNEIECDYQDGEGFGCIGLAVVVDLYQPNGGNCIELWVVDADGNEGPHREYQALGGYGRIDALEGCE